MIDSLNMKTTNFWLKKKTGMNFQEKFDDLSNLEITQFRNFGFTIWTTNKTMTNKNEEMNETIENCNCRKMENWIISGKTLSQIS